MSKAITTSNFCQHLIQRQLRTVSIYEAVSDPVSSQPGRQPSLFLRRSGVFCRIDMRRIVAVCVGDEELARSMVVRGLREIADEIERGGGKPRVRWDEERKIPLMNTD